MGATSVRIIKPEWKLVCSYAADYQLEGERTECYVTESAEKPTTAPDGNKAGSVVVRTIQGGQPYSFRTSDGDKLWAYPKNNGGVITVFERAGSDTIEATRFTGVTAFGEAKVAEYSALAAWAFPYNISVLNYVETEENGGTVTHDGSFAVVSTGTASDGHADLRTRRTVRYQPGVGGLCRFTAIFTEGVADSIQRVGYGDDTDGFFFGYNGAEFGVFRIRAGVATFTAQDDWTDLLGLSSDFDPTKLNVYQIQFQWLGAGEIRFYVENRWYGSPVLVHRIRYAGMFTDVSIQNPSLPISAHVENDGNTTDVQIKTPSASAGLEGSIDNRTLNGLLNAEDSKTIGGTLIPIVSIRMPTTYEGLTNRLAMRVLWIYFSTEGTSNAINTFRVYLNPTLTNPTWNQIVPGGAPPESDIAATAITGGQQVTSLSLPTSAVQQLDLLNLEAQLVAGDILSVAAISTGSIDCSASITFDSEL